MLFLKLSIADAEISAESRAESPVKHGVDLLMRILELEEEHAQEVSRKSDGNPPAPDNGDLLLLPRVVE